VPALLEELDEFASDFFARSFHRLLSAARLTLPSEGSAA